MAKCNQLTSLPFKGLKLIVITVIINMLHRRFDDDGDDDDEIGYFTVR